MKQFFALGKPLKGSGSQIFGNLLDVVTHMHVVLKETKEKKTAYMSVAGFLQEKNPCGSRFISC